MNHLVLMIQLHLGVGTTGGELFELAVKTPPVFQRICTPGVHPPVFPGLKLLTHQPGLQTLLWPGFSLNCWAKKGECAANTALCAGMSRPSAFRWGVPRALNTEQ